jgi:hypothetical protein
MIRKRHLALLLSIILFTLSCGRDKSSDAAPKLLQNLKVLGDNQVKWAINAIPGNGVFLITFVDTQDQYQFKLLDNNGKELWTKNFGYKFQVSPRTQTGIAKPDTTIHVVYLQNESFAIFRGNRLKIINLAGEVVLSKNNFLKKLSQFKSAKILLKDNGNFLVMGELEASGNRAFISEHSPTGNQIHINSFTVNVNGINTFSDALALDSGQYLLAGSFQSNTDGLSSAFFSALLKDNGQLKILKQNPTACQSCIGRQLLTSGADEYIFLMSPTNNNSADRESTIYRLNSQGNIKDQALINFTEYNVAASQSLLKKQDGTFIGLIKTNDDRLNYTINSAGNIVQKPSTYTEPVYSYQYQLNPVNMSLNKSFFTTSYSNYISIACTLSNGEILFFGAVESLGEGIQLALIKPSN